MLIRVSIIAALVALALAGSGSASRAPTPAEHAAIVEVVRGSASGLPARCFDANATTRVSTVDTRYALTDGSPVRRTAACSKYVANGFQVLYRYYGQNWAVVFTGSDPPGCRDMPPAVTRDLTRLRCLP